MVKTLDDLQKIRSIADYQFGRKIGQYLFPENVEILKSKKTGKIRHIHLNGERLATLRPRDGFLILTLTGGKRLLERDQLLFWVMVNEEVAPFIARGENAFAKHVKNAHEEIRPQDEVIIINENHEILAVGKAKLSGEEMIAFQEGVAVHVRNGIGSLEDETN